ncbi:fimbrial protein [Lelliottia sp. SL45]|uniref:fimbrial protein n=1 Tax=Lelliottia sp. SL45 TaxID=2994665 RepID=UPI0022745D09|nr:fimbrial protein [Lelliottia sp. SL45]MCY1700956.1 fimbrial protein [Lelliottia sp. SL45]
MKNTIIALAVAMSFVSGASQAAGQGSGTVTFTGTVIDAPCSIAPESADQTIDLGQIALAGLSNATFNGSSTPVPFNIQLNDCTLGTIQTSTTTFAGTAGSPGMLATSGTAKGISVGLNEGDGTALPVGTESKAFTLAEGSNTLEFSAYVQGNGTLDKPKAGDFTAVATFEMAYQ